MTLTDKLDKLFTDWKATLEVDETFYHDGIINEEIYNNLEPGKRLLIIAKEPNGENHKDNGYHSFVEEWNNSEPKYTFAKCIGDWAYGFLNNFPPFDTIGHKKYEGLKQIAFMNIKKTYGGGDVKNKIIYDAAKERKKLIVDEINIISPDVIICCLGFGGEVIKTIFDNIELKPSGCGINVAHWGNKKIIEFYHPSVRSGGAAFYSLLREVMSGWV